MQEGQGYTAQAQEAYCEVYIYVQNGIRISIPGSSGFASPYPHSVTGILVTVSLSI